MQLPRIIRFGAAGLVATLFYLLLANAFVAWIGMSPQWGSVSAYLASLTVSYLLQSRFTFGVKQDSVGQMTRFAVTSIAGLGLSWVVIHLIVTRLSWPYVVATVLICILIPVVNYFAFKGWVFAAGLRRLQRGNQHEEH